MRKRWVSRICTGLFGAFVFGGIAWGQDLEPRTYSASPTGANFVVAGAARSSGDVLLDPVLPVTDGHATVYPIIIGGGTTFNFFGRTALVVGVFPYAWATATGKIGEQTPSVSRSGLADSRFRFSVNFIGGKALSLKQFLHSHQSTIVGASLSVVAPMGQYDPQRLVNLGSNRWSFKPEVGVSHRVRKWTIEEYVGAWLFTANNKFFPGDSVRTQRPVFAFQAHVSYTIKPRLWAAFNWTWYKGGTSAINGIDTGVLYSNTRVGGTLSLPLYQQQSLKIAVSKGVTTRIGQDFTTISAAWQLSWFSRQNATVKSPRP